MDEKLLTYLNIRHDPKAVEVSRPLWEKAKTLARIRTWQSELAATEFFHTFSPFAARSRHIMQLLENSARVKLLAASIGKELEEEARRLIQANKPFQGYILDRMGSWLVEREIRKMDRRIKESAREQGCSATHRYSPGYMDFSIRAQEVFMELIGSAIPGLSLTPEGLMLPEKTVTALKGIEPAAGPDR